MTVMRQIILFGLAVTMCAVLAGGRFTAPMPSPAVSLEADGPAIVPAPDTLQHRVTAGEPLILTLPEALTERPVASYRLVRAPALSWLVDRSLLWHTRSGDAGRHTLLVRAAFDEAPPDTLTILVDVTD